MRFRKRLWILYFAAGALGAPHAAKADVRDIVLTLPPLAEAPVAETIPVDFGGPVQHIGAIVCSVDVVESGSMYYCNYCRPEPILPGPCDWLQPFHPWFSISFISGDDYVSFDAYVQDGAHTLVLEFPITERTEAIFAQGAVDMRITYQWAWWNPYSECMADSYGPGEIRSIGSMEFTSDLKVHVEYAPAVSTDAETFGHVKVLYR